MKTIIMIQRIKYHFEDVIKIFFCKKCGSSPPDFVIFVLICGDFFVKIVLKIVWKKKNVLKVKSYWKK